MINFGLYQGASAKIPYDQMMDRQTQLMAVRRQTRIDAENKAKLMGDDMKFATMYSDYQREKLNGFYSDHLKKMGDFVIKNPDMQMDPVKMMMFGKMKQEMLDNPIVAADMRFKNESEAMTKFLAENPDTWQNDPDVMRMLKERDNYNKYGTTTPGQGNKDFIFINPDSKVNLVEELRNHFSKVDYDQFAEIQGNQKNGYQKWISDDQAYRAGQAFLGLNPKFQRIVKNTFSNLSPDEQKKYVTADGSPDYAAWVKDQGKVFLKQKEYETPVDYKPSTTGNGTGGNDATASGGTIDYYQRDLQNATKRNGNWSPANAKGIVNAKMNAGRANLSDASLLTVAGNNFTPNDQDSIPAITDAARMALSNTKYATPTGEIRLDPQSGTYKAKWNIEMPIEEFKTTFPEWNDIIDSPFLGMGGTTARSLDNNFSDSPSSVFKVVTVTDNNGKAHDVVKFNVESLLDGTKGNHDLTIASGYNHGVDGIPKVAGVNDLTPVRQVQKDGKIFDVVVDENGIEQVILAK